MTFITLSIADPHSTEATALGTYFLQSTLCNLLLLPEHQSHTNWSLAIVPVDKKIPE